MGRARDKLITQGDREREISWDEVVLKVRVPSVHRATAAKHMLRELGVKVLHPRAKLTRSKIDEAERKRIRNRLRKLPSNDWTSTIRLTMDNKRWPLPLSLLGKKSLRQTKVRLILRNKQDGLKKGYAKPDKREHRTNLGCVNVVAGITKWTDRIWHYFDGKWDAEKAAQVYRTVVAPALRRAHGGKRQYTIVEDNDPTGYKSSWGIAAKRELNIVPIEYPTLSPDTNACAYALWDEVERRMSLQVAPKRESRDGVQGQAAPHGHGHSDEGRPSHVGKHVGPHPGHLRRGRWTLPTGLRARDLQQVHTPNVCAFVCIVPHSWYQACVTIRFVAPLCGAVFRGRLDIYGVAVFNRKLRFDYGVSVTNKRVCNSEALCLRVVTSSCSCGRVSSSFVSLTCLLCVLMCAFVVFVCVSLWC